ncbi:MAG: hypothetical protein EOL86_08820 [Deltaproteobacteria bacterium]|nr:hypothetical protein [Desulfovibrionaceae bacterium]NCD25678.1 hypothetical protein [Deltaproteobacteria bacterium]
MKIAPIPSLLLVLILSQGCMVALEEPPSRRGGPPPHAPAHGYRAMYRYNYYPDVRVYFDLDRHLYFYLDNGWRRATRLPREFRARLGAPVVLTLDVDRPYTHHDEHRRAYPPGQSRKKPRKWR